MAQFISLDTYYREYPVAEMQERAKNFYAEMNRRRTVREFSSRSVPQEIIETCIRTAGTAPNGANLQPWHFVVVRDPQIKKRIRQEAEKEEKEFYTHRAPKTWLKALAALGTDAHKPFLETAPYLIVIFGQNYHFDDEKNKIPHYYVKESVGIAAGMLITALHHAGLVTLTHTPSPMHFLNQVLERPTEEKPFLILVTGYPAEQAQIPAVAPIKKPLEEITTFI